MIEIQVRMPCSQPGVNEVGGQLRCRECGESTWTNRPECIQHALMIRWMPLEEALARILRPEANPKCLTCKDTKQVRRVYGTDYDCEMSTVVRGTGEAY